MGFGGAVAIDGDKVLIGAGGNNQIGSAHVFNREGTTWTHRQTLAAEVPRQLDRFGCSVVLAGSLAVIGAEGEGGGTVHVFEDLAGNWTRQSRLVADDTLPGDRFGAVVAMKGDVLVIGSPGDDTPAGTDVGSLTVFQLQAAAWDQQARILAPEGKALDRFGLVIALSSQGDLIAGDPQADTSIGIDAGNVYALARQGDTWPLLETVTAGDGGGRDFFGQSVALDGDTALVGAYGDGTAASSDCGLAYLLTRKKGNWSFQAVLAAPDGANGDRFGWRRALDGTGPGLPRAGGSLRRSRRCARTARVAAASVHRRPHRRLARDSMGRARCRASRTTDRAKSPRSPGRGDVRRHRGGRLHRPGRRRAARHRAPAHVRASAPANPLRPGNPD